GVTVRTVPRKPNGDVLWPTKIVGIDFSAIMHNSYERSRVASLLDSILFVPIRKPDARHVGGWSFDNPVLWVTDDRERQQFHSDYEEIRALVLEGRADELSSSARHGQGRWLMPKTSGRDSSDIVTYVCGG